jgi:hypothetical protein
MILLVVTGKYVLIDFANPIGIVPYGVCFVLGNTMFLLIITAGSVSHLTFWEQ